MIKHIVFFKSDNRDNIKIIKKELEKLPNIISEIKIFELGLNITNSLRAWDMSLISMFDDMQGLKSYASNPHHQKVVSMIKEFGIETCVVDSSSCK
jgi:hypothetical protein